MRTQGITLSWSCTTTTKASTINALPIHLALPLPTLSTTYSCIGCGLGPCSKPEFACSSCIGLSVGLRFQVSPRPSTSRSMSSLPTIACCSYPTTRALGGGGEVGLMASCKKGLVSINRIQRVGCRPQRGGHHKQHVGCHHLGCSVCLQEMGNKGVFGDHLKHGWIIFLVAR